MRTTLFLLVSLLLAAAAAAQTSRRYALRDTFSRFNSDRCFELTREEGERAFRGKDWETAASLFRAAKNCADADQAKRSQMSQRIREAREAAIAALVEKEREATRTARHAIATNRANDALLLLKDGHRSLAFRLADFADRYIAPPDGEPNTQCRQAMLDAWDYIPYYHSWMRDQPDQRVPFCFQVAENLGRSTQIRFQQRSGAARLYAFSPKDHLLRSWSGNLSEVAEPVRMDMDTALLNFEASPDGQTLLFRSARRWVLWRSASNFYPIEVNGGTSLGAFNTDGSAFYYLERSQIRSVTLSKAFGTRTSNRAYQQQRNSYKSNLAETLSPIEIARWPEVDMSGLLGFAVKGSKAYLAYPDRVLVTEADTAIACPMPYTLPADARPEQLRFWLREQLLTYANDTLFIRFQLPASGSGPVIQQMGYGEQLVAFGPQLLVTRERTGDLSTSRAFFRENLSDISHFSRNDAEDYAKNRWLGGAVSPDGSRCATLSDDGTLRVFELEKTASGTAMPYYQTQNTPLQFTPDGRHFAVLGAKSLEIFRADNLEQPISTRSTTALYALGNRWAVYPCSPDSIEAFHFQTGRWQRIRSGDGANLVSLSSDERLLACSGDGDGPRVFALEGNAPPLSRTEGTQVYRALFVPNSTKLMIIANTSAFDNDGPSGVVVKFWDTARPDLEPEVLLLPSYPHVTLSPDGRWAAFAMGSTRIFDLNNLSEEYTALRGQRPGEAAVSTATFSPDGRLFVMGYDDGHTIAWDIATRRQAYRLAPSMTRAAKVAQLNFSPDGRTLRQVLLPTEKKSGTGGLSLTNTFTTRLLDFGEMRRHLSEGTRQLSSFSPTQILDYNLETALSYPGNFERLARSGDLPLIRSFFDFYQQQAEQSNNSAQVRQYCDRAFQLYQNLDAANREALRWRMLSMYDNLIWKLIQRNKPAEAADALQHVSRHFGPQLSLTRWAGHVALLRGEGHLKTAAQCYVDWIIRSTEEKSDLNALNESQEAWRSVYGLLSNDLEQLHTYKLLREPQRQMLCTLLGERVAFTFCRETLPSPETAGASAHTPAAATPLALDATTQQRWRIFQGLTEFRPDIGFSEKNRLLEGYLDDAKKLARQNAAYRPMLERAALLLAEHQRNRGDFEQGNDRSLQHYAQAARTVQDIFPFKKYATEYWSLVSALYQSTGDIYLARGNTLKAAQAYHESYKMLQNFQAAAESTLSIWDLSGRLGNLYTQLGIVSLYENRPNEADTLFEAANRALPDALNGLYYAHSALLRGDRDDAMLNYGDIESAQQMGDVLAQIERMAEQVPARRAAMLEFMGDLRRAAAQVKSEIDSVETQYYYAQAQVAHFAATQQWGKAQQWSREALRCADRLASRPAQASEFADVWFNAHLNAAYYHLLSKNRDTAALSAAVRYSRAAEKRIADGAYYANADYLKTNLAHALLLRSGPGDRAAALAEYRAFLELGKYSDEYWELLQKDFRDLTDAGVQWPADMHQIIQQLQPKVKGPDEKR